MGLTRTLAAVVFGSVLWMAAGGAVRASDATDLCRIPFTEAHRSALEHRHIPALRKILEDWKLKGEEHARIGGLPYLDVDKALVELDRTRTEIAALAVAETSGKAPSSSPDREGPAILPAAPGGSVVFEMDADHRLAFDAAMQAILHAACAADEADVVEHLVIQVLGWRGDLGSGSQGHRMSYRDWNQIAQIAYRHLETAPHPSSGSIAALSGILALLIEPLFDPRWQDIPDQTTRREKMRLDLAEWISRGNAQSDFKVNWLSNSLFGFRAEEKSELSDPNVLEIGLELYDQEMQKGAASDSPDHEAHVYLLLEMIQLTILARAPEQAKCFLSLVDQEIQKLENYIRVDKASLFRNRRSDLLETAYQAFGSTWNSTIEDLTHCYRSKM